MTGTFREQKTTDSVAMHRRSLFYGISRPLSRRLPPAAQGQLLVPMPIGLDAIMTDSHEPRRQHVQRQPPDELQRRQRHDPLAIPMGIVLVTKADHAVLEVEQADIADR